MSFRAVAREEAPSESGGWTRGLARARDEEGLKPGERKRDGEEKRNWGLMKEGGSE